MISDLRFASRQLLKSPGFTLLALLTLALGIGLSSAIFSLIDDLFLRGLPFHQQERVVHIFANATDRDLVEVPVSAPRYLHYRAGQSVFENLAAENFSVFTLTGLGDPVQIAGGRLTPNYFDLLRVRPIMGRNFLPQEEETADVAIVTENFWHKRLGGTADVIGRSVTLDGVAHTIVGVIPNMPAAWFGSNPVAEIWTTKPFFLPGFPRERVMRGTGFLRVIGRMKDGLSLDQVRASLPSLDHGYLTQNPANIDASSVASIKTMPEDATGNLRPAFITLIGAVAFVLLIACSNVANLLLVRFSGRRREIALRMALGAERASVLRLFVLESVLLSVLAGGLGAFIAWQLVPLVPRMAANFLPLEADYGNAGLSLPVLAFTIGLSLLTGLAMGIYPAWQSSRADLVDALKEGGRGSSGSVRQQRFRKLLVGGQVALSATLLAGAALLIMSFVRLSQQNLGFNPANLWVGFVTLPESRYATPETRTRFVEQALQNLHDIPGFESATISTDIPLNGGTRVLYARADRDVPPLDKRAAAPEHDIVPGYLRTWDIPLLAGRDFSQHDLATGQNVILIAQSGARKIFGNENPIGKMLLVTSAAVPAEIVGVVGDVRSQKVADAPGMEFYRPWTQENFPFVSITVRTPQSTAAVTRLVQGAVNRIDPGLAIAQPQRMSEVVAQALGQARLMTWLLGIFAGVALLLATVGIYGAVAYTVEQRTGEIGVRMALGAQTADVLRMIIGQGMLPVLIGLGVGIGASIALGRLLASQLYQTPPFSPSLLLGTIIVLALAALLACLFPARRASALNPVDALRTE